LPGAVQAQQDDLPVFFLGGDKAHLGTSDGFADGGAASFLPRLPLMRYGVRTWGQSV
jgi:hypothetical protein